MILLAIGFAFGFAAAWMHARRPTEDKRPFKWTCPECANTSKTTFTLEASDAEMCDYLIRSHQETHNA